MRGAGGGDGAKSEVIAEGRLSAEQGRLKSILIEDSEKARYAELIYIGERAWHRAADGPWQPMSLSQPGQSAPDVLEVFTYFLPGDVPNEALRSAMPLTGGELFGLNQYSFLYQGTTLPDATMVSTETVNGVRSLHYRGKAQVPGSQGEESPMEINLWIAAEGHHLVRYAVTQKDGQNARHLQVDITNIDEPFSVEAPRQ